MQSMNTNHNVAQTQETQQKKFKSCEIDLSILLDNKDFSKLDGESQTTLIDWITKQNIIYACSYYILFYTEELNNYKTELAKFAKNSSFLQSQQQILNYQKRITECESKILTHTKLIHEISQNFNERYKVKLENTLKAVDPSITVKIANPSIRAPVIIDIPSPKL